MKRPYDVRHSGITWRLDSGVPDAKVAARAGHSVEMLRRVYAGRAKPDFGHILGLILVAGR
jgi:integrase